MSAGVTETIQIAAIVVPVLYSIFVESNRIVNRNRRRIEEALENLSNISKSKLAPALTFFSVMVPILLLLYFDSKNLDVSYAVIYIPSIAAVALGAALFIVRKLYVVIFSAPGFIYFVWLYDYTSRPYLSYFWTAYGILFLFYTIYTVVSWKIPNIKKSFVKFYGIPQMAGFASFSFQILYISFSMSMGYITSLSGVVPKVTLGNLVIIYLMFWASFFTLSMALGIRNLVQDYRRSILSSSIEAKSMIINAKITTRGKFSPEGEITSVGNSLTIKTEDGHFAVVPWNLIQGASFKINSEGDKKENSSGKTKDRKIKK